MSDSSRSRIHSSFLPSRTNPAQTAVSRPQSAAAAAESAAPRIGRSIDVLVLNDSQEMAKEMTMQITLAMPGCSITYAPTLELAKWILSRRHLDLLVSSPVLPDGGVSRLGPTLKELQSPPDVVVVGNVQVDSALAFGKSGYEFAAYRKIGEQQEESRQTVLPLSGPEFDSHLKTLGADIRNDLNNPLQEIVAMVFVARSDGEVGNGTSQALSAIDQAARNMASYVRGLEDKIRGVVNPEVVQ